MFRVTSKGGVKIFLPIDAVLKNECNSLTNSHSHSCTGSRDEHNSLDEVTSEVTNEGIVANKQDQQLNYLFGTHMTQLPMQKYVPRAGIWNIFPALIQ